MKQLVDFLDRTFCSYPQAKTLLKNRKFWMAAGGLILFLIVLIIGRNAVQRQRELADLEKTMIVAFVQPDQKTNHTLETLFDDLEENTVAGNLEFWLVSPDLRYGIARINMKTQRELTENGYWVAPLADEGIEKDELLKTIQEEMWVVRIECPGGNCEKYLANHSDLFAKFLYFDRADAVVVAVIERQFVQLLDKGMRTFLLGFGL
mgnify:CR=1 FL=1